MEPSFSIIEGLKMEEDVQSIPVGSGICVVFLKVKSSLRLKGPIAHDFAGSYLLMNCSSVRPVISSLIS
jgi:hypothetical protein